jgi:hypothetical protein
VVVDDPMTNSGTPSPRALGLTENRAHGVVVAIPSLPRKNEVLVVVEIKLPTVSCDVVAMRALPAALLVMMELGEKKVEPVPPFGTARVPVNDASDRQLPEIA